MADEFMKAALYGIKTFNKKAKEKIGMEKLVELLNERMKEEEKIGPKHSRFLNYDGINHVFRLNNGCSFCMEFVLSKRYGFIKWLVENEKIDIEKLQDKDAEYSFHYSFEDYEVLLMLLAIQDEPIEFLISILK